MNAIKIFFLLLFFTGVSNAQVNLVPNPSFEDTVGCPSNISGEFGDEIYNLTYWFPGSKSPDYFNSCAPVNQSTGQASVPYNGFGFQYANSGVGYIGIFTALNSILFSDYREYIGVQLTQTLSPGTTYYFSMKVSSGWGSWQNISSFSNKLGILLSNNYYESFINPLLPTNTCTVYSDSIITDTLNWTTINFEFVADSNYTYIYLGNFFDAQNTDTLYITGQGAYYYIDDVCLSTDSNFCETWTGLPTIDKNNINIWPNPIQNYFQFSAKQLIDEVTIYDSRGKLIKSENVNAVEGRIDFDVLSAGVYLVVFRRESDVSLHKFLKF